MCRWNTKNGKSERVDINKLEDYVTKLTAESEERAETVKEATVYYDTEFCKNNVDIIDTPGLNDDDQMTNVTLSILPKIDAAVFVISANSPFLTVLRKSFLEKEKCSLPMWEELSFVVKLLRYFLTGRREQDSRNCKRTYWKIRYGKG